MKIKKTVMPVSMCLMLSALAGSAAAAGMQVTSPAFADNGEIPRIYAGNGECGGQNVSPPIAWSNLPPGTKSVAILILDPDGAKGLGVSHWVAYNIAANRGQLKQGDGQNDGVGGVTVGKNVSGATAYRGMCPPAGDLPHHYAMTVIATDLEPSALPRGLSRDELLDALKGHALGGQSIVGRYAR